MSQQDESKDLTRRRESEVVPSRPDTIQLGENQELDISGLTDEQKTALKVKHAEGALERDDRRQKLKEDIAVTQAKLSTYSNAVTETSAEDASITITNTNEDSLGRTEVIVGNTEAARKGKLTRSQTGFGDNITLWVVLAGIAAVVIVLVAALT